MVNFVLSIKVSVGIPRTHDKIHPEAIRIKLQIGTIVQGHDNYFHCRKGFSIWDYLSFSEKV